MREKRYVQRIYIYMDQAALDRHKTFTVLLYMMHKYKNICNHRLYSLSGVFAIKQQSLVVERRLCAIVDVGLLLLVELSNAPSLLISERSPSVKFANSRYRLTRNEKTFEKPKIKDIIVQEIYIFFFIESIQVYLYNIIFTRKHL